MSSTSYMATYMREYKKTHPEYIEKSKTITNEFLKNKYATDPFYREYKKIQARERYRLKKQQSISI